MKKIFGFFLVLSLCFFSIGCSTQDLKADSVKIVRGDNQFLKPGNVSKDIEVEVLSQKIPGLFGGKGSRKNVSDVEVEFSLEKDSKIFLVDSDGNKKKSVSVITDHGGKARIKTFSEGFVGVGTVSYEVKDSNLKKQFMVCYGITISGKNQEGLINHSLENPLGIKVYDVDGNGLNGIKVFFESVGGNSSKVFPESLYTDSNGLAMTSLSLGSKTGKYPVYINIDYPGVFFPNIKINTLGVDPQGLGIFLLGSLAIFIFGMKMMSDGLQRIAGNKLKKILNFLTKNRVMALGVGAVTTAVIQSSSACTVMIVGFLNAGLLGLRQSMAAIMGANIGTTITGQIIALKIKDMAFPAVIIGIILIVMFRNKKVSNWGEFIFGFGLLFIGMKGMGDALHPLRESEAFKSFFAMFDCMPVNGYMPFTKVLGAVFTGAVITAIIQSSSATIGLTMALAGSGLISFWTAFPLILGDNIGTTITAVFAAIPANRNAKRAGLFHSIFNVTGAFIMALLLYVTIENVPVFLYFIDRITPGDVFSDSPVNIQKHIAMAHSFFNVTMAIVLLPFINIMARFIEKILPLDDSEKKKIKHLEENLLDTPELAFNQVSFEFSYMLEVASKNVFRSYSDFTGDKKNKKDKIEKKEEVVDELQEEITKYLVRLSERKLSKSQAIRIPNIIHCVNDAERIGDLAEKIQRLKAEKEKNNTELSQELIMDLRKFKEAIEKSFELIQKAIKGDKNAIERLMKNEDYINDLRKEIIESNIVRLKDGTSSVRGNIVFTRMINTFERIGDHYVNIGERLRFIKGE